MRVRCYNKLLRAFPGNDVVAKQLHWILKHNQLSYCRGKYGKQWKQQKKIYSSPYNSIMKTSRETFEGLVGYNGKLCIPLVSSIKCDKWMQNTIVRFDLRKFPAFEKGFINFNTNNLIKDDELEIKIRIKFNAAITIIHACVLYSN